MPRGRPRKYHSEQQRRAARSAQRVKNKKYCKQRLSGRYFRLVIPALAGYPPAWRWDSPAIHGLRARAVDLISARQRARGLTSYLVAVERAGERI